MFGRGEWSRSRDALVAGYKGIAEAVLVAALFGSRLFTLVPVNWWAGILDFLGEVVSTM